MKKIVLAIAAALTISMGAMAQEEQGNDRPRDNRQMNPTEMVQRRTDAIVKKYGLNEEQAAKLLELNKKYANAMRPNMRGRGGRPERMGRPQHFNNDSTRAMRRPMRQRPDRDSTMQRPPRMDQTGMEEMRKNMEAYETELKGILTEEQYKAYQEDQQKRSQRRGGGPRGMRPENNAEK